MKWIASKDGPYHSSYVVGIITKARIEARR